MGIEYVERIHDQFGSNFKGIWDGPIWFSGFDDEFLEYPITIEVDGVVVLAFTSNTTMKVFNKVVDEYFQALTRSRKLSQI
jgi:hypothetical protein